MEYTEDDVVLMKDFYEEMGRDSREWDPAYHTLRRAGHAISNEKPGVYVLWETLTDPLRIERIRWQALLNYSAHIERSAALAIEMTAMPDTECFIPVDKQDLQQWLDRGDLKPEEIERYSNPRRVYAREDLDGDNWVSYDDDFWEYKKLRHCEESDLEVLASAGALGEWEQITKPARLKRAADPAKLALGKRWKHEVTRGFRLQERCWFSNEMLQASLLNSDQLPEGPRTVQKHARVRLNGRVYIFNVGRGHKSSNFDLWPNPKDLDEVIITGKVKMPERRF